MDLYFTFLLTFAQTAFLHCFQHGGGIRCKLEGCNRVAIGKAQLCRAHGGGAHSRFNAAAI